MRMKRVTVSQLSTTAVGCGQK